MTLPTAPDPVVYAPDFVVVREGDAAVVATVDWGLLALTAVPAGVRPVAVAVLRTEPASTSDWRMV